VIGRPLIIGLLIAALIPVPTPVSERVSAVISPAGVLQAEALVGRSVWTHQSPAPLLSRRTLLLGFGVLSGIRGWGQPQTNTTPLAPRYFIEQSGGLDAFVERYPELKEALVSRSIQDPALREQIAGVYVLFLFLRDGGFSGLGISPVQTDLEWVLMKQLGGSLQKLSLLDKGKFLLNPKKFVEERVRTLLRDMEQADPRPLDNIFVRHSYEASMTPALALILFGSLGRHFYSEMDAKIWAANKTRLVLQWSVGEARFITEIEETASRFDVKEAKLAEPTLGVLQEYDAVKGYVTPQTKDLSLTDLPGRYQRAVFSVAPQVFGLHYFIPFAERIVPYLLRPESLLFFRFSSEQFNAWRALKNAQRSFLRSSFPGHGIYPYVQRRARQLLLRQGSSLTLLHVLEAARRLSLDLQTDSKNLDILLKSPTVRELERLHKKAPAFSRKSGPDIFQDLRNAVLNLREYRGDTLLSVFESIVHDRGQGKLRQEVIEYRKKNPDGVKGAAVLLLRNT